MPRRGDDRSVVWVSRLDQQQRLTVTSIINEAADAFSLHVSISPMAGDETAQPQAGEVDSESEPRSVMRKRRLAFCRDALTALAGLHQHSNVCVGSAVSLHHTAGFLLGQPCELVAAANAMSLPSVQSVCACTPLGGALASAINTVVTESDTGDDPAADGCRVALFGGTWPRGEAHNAAAWVQRSGRWAPQWIASSGT